MAPLKRSKDPSGRYALDAVNGLRAGTFIGGLIGAALVAITGFSSFWIIVGLGATGGLVGFFVGKRPGPSQRGSENQPR